MSPVIKWTLWQRRWSIAWWSLGIAALIILTLAFYPAFRNQAQLNSQLSQIPQAAKSLISDTGDFLSPEGYLSSQIFYLMLPMILSILSIGMGSSLIAKEESEGTIELLLSRPISRTKLLLGKAIAGAVILIIVGSVAVFFTVVLSRLVNLDVASSRIAIAGALSILISLLFGAIAFALSALGDFGRLASIGVSVMIALAGYIIASLASVVDWLRWPAKVLPYNYYHPARILSGYYPWWDFIGFLIVIACLMVLSWLFFRRRDIGA